MNKEKEYLKEEIRKEFQLERMILFSDAVFAIVITLMAIEIHVPDLKFSTNEQLSYELLHLLPTFIAYAASFLFIGITWYEHLQIFSLLKDYDKGLVIRNLLMLFFIGLFPFSATLIARPGNNTLFASIFIYFLIVILSKVAQLNLHQYILIKRPGLQLKTDIRDHISKYKRSRLAIILLCIIFFLVSGTFYFIDDPTYRYFAWWWFFPFPFVLKYFQKKIK
jgi:uncharacterized membrane protein